MGLLDALIGNVLGSALGGNQRQDPLGSVLGGLGGRSQGQGGNLLLQVLLSLLQQNGGLEGVLGRLRQGGLGQQADSWVGTGQNMNISAGSAATDIRFVDNQRSRSPAWYAGRGDRFDDGPGAAGGHQPADAPGQVPENGDEEIAEGLSMLANPELLRRV